MPETRTGKLITLDEYKGKKVVLYFYPKDNTPGCTAEACDLRDNYSRFQEQGYEIIGVSADSEKSHQNFISKYQLPFRLISDLDKRSLRTMKHGVRKKCTGRPTWESFEKPISSMKMGMLKKLLKK